MTNVRTQKEQGSELPSDGWLVQLLLTGEQMLLPPRPPVFIWLRIPVKWVFGGVCFKLCCLKMLLLCFSRWEPLIKAFNCVCVWMHLSWILEQHQSQNKGWPSGPQRPNSTRLRPAGSTLLEPAAGASAWALQADWCSQQSTGRSCSQTLSE